MTFSTLLSNEQLEGLVPVLTRDGKEGHIQKVNQGDRMGVECEFYCDDTGETFNTWIFAKDQANYKKAEKYSAAPDMFNTLEAVLQQAKNAIQNGDTVEIKNDDVLLPSEIFDLIQQVFCRAGGNVELLKEPKIPNARTNLINNIKEYESDTFSASGSEITHQEAEQVADTLINEWVESDLDGVAIDHALYDIRDES